MVKISCWLAFYLAIKVHTPYYNKCMYNSLELNEPKKKDKQGCWNLVSTPII